MRCERCGKETSSFIMSMFNTEMICMDCKTAEKNHPDYQKAVDTEHAEVCRGNYNFQGIGKPKNL